MKWFFAALFFVGLLVLPACGGGGAASAGSMVPAPSLFAQWNAVVRYEPALLTLSLSNPAMQFLYVDSVPVNGAVPSAQDFWNGFETANSNLLAGPCSAIATLSDALISPNSYSGQTTPTVVISAYPRSTGDCTQTLNIGSNQSRQFTIHITN